MTDKKKDRPFVFVRCMTFNHEAYIKDALNGFVMQQTNFPFVVAIVDDASTDNNARVIREYLQRVCDSDSIKSTIEEYGKVIDATPLDNPNCLLHVVLLNENHYLKKTKRPYYAQYEDAAQYVAMCEGDDYWTDPLKLQKQVDFLEANPEYGLCYTDYNRLEDATHTLTESMFEKQNQYRPIFYEQHLLKPGYLAPMTWLYRHELMTLIAKANVHTDGTYAYMLEFLYNSKVAYIPQVTAVYRSHAGSASFSSDDKTFFRYTIGVFRTQIHYTQEYSCTDELKNKVLMRGYLSNLPIAIMAEQEDFVHEVKTFMESQDMDIDLIIRELKQGEMKRKSYAYRLGKKLLAPFSLLRKKRK